MEATIGQRGIAACHEVAADDRVRRLSGWRLDLGRRKNGIDPSLDASLLLGGTHNTELTR